MNTKQQIAPIILFVYNRPEHTRYTVESLANNSLAKESILYIFSDAEKNDSTKEKVSEVRQYIASLNDLNYFDSVVIEEAKRNKGLADSVIDGVTKIIQKYGCAIVLEDDLVTAPDFLDFMNQSLLYYEKDVSIGSVTGYSPLSKLPDNYKKDVWVASRISSHGWATWKDRWMQVDWKVNDFEVFKRDKKARKRFDACGSDQYDRLRRQIEVGANSWATIFAYWQFRAGLYTVFPVQSRLQNIGWDGSGVHTGAGKGYENRILSRSVPFKLSREEPSELIISMLKSLYSGPMTSRIAKYLRNNGFEKLESILRTFAGK